MLISVIQGLKPLNALEKELAQKDVAAFVIEPIQGEGGFREWTQSQWDEIQIAMGRTGKFFDYEHWGIEPDFVCLSKALTNGMVPCSVTLGTKKVFSAVFNRLDRCMVHSSTFSENNLAMAAALGVIDQLDKLDLISQVAFLGNQVKNQLIASLGDFDLVKEIRGKGLMFAIEFGAPAQSGE